MYPIAGVVALYVPRVVVDRLEVKGEEFLEGPLLGTTLSTSHISEIKVW